jgi:hypothetical protein
MVVSGLHDIVLIETDALKNHRQFEDSKVEQLLG